MSVQENTPFQKALDTIESLPEHQQEDVIKIIGKRLIEKKRESLANRIQEAREEYSRGEIQKGTIDDLLKELDK